MKHSFFGILGSVMTYFTSFHLLQVIPQDSINTLISAVVSIVAGVLTGFLSKWLNKYFVNQVNQKVISNQAQTIIDLQNKIQSLSQQSPYKDSTATK